MHIPDAYLSPATEVAAYAVMIPIWAVAARRTVRQLSTKQVPLLSIGAAFCFAVQMFNIPTVGGTTAHALGSVLLAILVGPWAALLGMTLSLTVQALLFGDGGILSLGANCWDMGVVACFVGYGLYQLLAGNSPGGSVRRVISAGVAAYAGTVAASFSAGVLLGIQPAIAHDAAGHALYCPFGLNVSVPAMVMSHLLAAGPADAIITVAAMAYLWQSFPDFFAQKAQPKVGTGLRIAKKLGWVLVLTPIGLIATGDAFGEWDLETLKKLVGYAPSGIQRSHELVHPLLPDYGFAGMDGKPWAIAGYLISAVLGCLLVAGFTRGLIRRTQPGVGVELPPGAPQPIAPAWMLHPNPDLAITESSGGNWLARTMLRMRATVEKTVVSETVARANGLLQRANPLGKLVVLLIALLAVGLAQSIWVLLSILAVTGAVASASQVPMRSLAIRVGGSVAFFGIVVAVPIWLQSGPEAAAMMLLRLAAGITLAIVWNLTTRWQALLKSLRSIGVPQVFVTSMALTYRYLFVIMETLAEMVEARTARQFGALDKRQARSYAGAGSAILFAKSVALTDEVHMAMISRSFGG